MTLNYYQAGIQLLKVLAKLEGDLKYNYQKGTAGQRALANIAGLQCDLFSSYIVLLDRDEKGPVVGRSVILRSILENQGTILHIKGSEKRSKAYLNHVEKIKLQVKNHVEGVKTSEKDLMWSTSRIKHRVGLIDKNAPRLYDMLSNFSHGNNIQYFLNTKKLTDAYIKAIDSYYFGLFISFLAEIGIGLNMDDSKRKLVFDSINLVAKQTKEHT